MARLAPLALASSHGLRDFVRFAGNDQLAGTIQIRQHHARFGANFTRGRLVQADDRRHAASGDVAGFLHEPTTLTHHAQAILEAHGARRRQGREFAKRQAGGGMKLERRHLLLEQLEGDPAHQENARLGVFGLGQFRLPGR